MILIQNLKRKTSFLGKPKYFFVYNKKRRRHLYIIETAVQVETAGPNQKHFAESFCGHCSTLNNENT